jgi:hypothetical protein
MDEIKINLPADVAKQYKPSAQAVRVFYLAGKKIDLNKVDLATAETLVKHQVLEPVKEDTTAKKS